ncbi:MAG: U32 family peptidase [Paludibacteraceae bacterium]|nr:U32 family peptidase [Paludibacteraceae bacterium]
MVGREYIELLAPAREVEHGIEAIKYGADAVYIGGPAFSARSAAGNSLEDIAKLVEFAHVYNARIYVALNTILTDEELAEAERLAWSLYKIGVDALIIQDYGLLRANLPPIALHASTQMDNRNLDKVIFWEKCGFEQVVLARETDVKSMADIASHTKVRLETFIHGALCVSYSGQCYMSQRMLGRSANRGECGQPCRMKYSLFDADGKTIAKDKYLLSLRDFSAEKYLAEMIKAGVSTFKIEGRLKDITYVKTTVAYYRRVIDEFLAKNNEYHRMSYGTSRYGFQPNLHKIFNRGLTTYNLSGKREKMANIDTPKSMGEYVGTTSLQKGSTLQIRLADKVALANGDGFCYVDRNGELIGFRANKAQGDSIELPAGLRVQTNAKLYRNLDIRYDTAVNNDTCNRQIDAQIVMTETPDGFTLEMTDISGDKAQVTFDSKKELAQNPQMANDNIVKTLKKTGGTPFCVTDVKIDSQNTYFFAMSTLNEWRRALINALISNKLSAWKREPRLPMEDNLQFPSNATDYRLNVHNAQAKNFIEQCGIANPAWSYEREPKQKAELMRCKYCIRYELGICLKKDTAESTKFKQPLKLVGSDGAEYTLLFDCKKCEMAVIGDVKK